MSENQVRARRSLKPAADDPSIPKKLSIKRSSTFHFDIWLNLTLVHWICDFGRGFTALYVSDAFPMTLPSIGDYGHMVYNVITGFCMLYILKRCIHPIPNYVQEFLVIVFVMGASIHLVGDSVEHRLILLGYKNHLPLQENPLMKNLTPPALIQSFQLLYFFDEYLGHELWCIPLFISYFLVFCGNFDKHVETLLSVRAWLLLIPSALEEWYVVTEAQIFHIFLIMLIAMLVVLCYHHRSGGQMDCNARWLLYRSIIVLVLIGVWSAYLWNDATLRQRYPQLLYVPEPWSYATLYILNH